MNDLQDRCASGRRFPFPRLSILKHSPAFPSFPPALPCNHGGPAPSKFFLNRLHLPTASSSYGWQETGISSRCCSCFSVRQNKPGISLTKPARLFRMAYSSCRDGLLRLPCRKSSRRPLRVQPATDGDGVTMLQPVVPACCNLAYHHAGTWLTTMLVLAESAC
ncbi:hypothetical protein GCAAIG_05365 [Candidatus Electronema halotolerans]